MNLAVWKAHPYSRSRDDNPYSNVGSLSSGKTGGGLAAASTFTVPWERSGQNQRMPCCSILG